MKIAFLTAGGIAPCLSSSISMLIQEYKKQNIDCEFIGYLYGYKGLLVDQKIIISQDFISFMLVLGFKDYLRMFSTCFVPKSPKSLLPSAILCKNIL